MKHAVKLLTAGVALAAVSVPAFAADLAEPQIIETPIYQAPESVPAAMSGWYIRGDVGYSWNDARNIEFYNVVADPLTGTFVPELNGVLNGELKSSFSIGAGVGYQLNHWARVDTTLDYDFSADFEGSTVGTCDFTALGGGATDACTSTDSSSFKALTVMANAYVDLGTYSGFTPYVGAGIGGAHVTWGDLTNVECDDATGLLCNTREHEGHSEWRFAYAVMAGVSYDVSHKLSVDLGYRYKKIEGGSMFGVNGNGPGFDGGITQHQVRAGLRYKFGGGKHKPAFHQPAVYK